MSGSSYDLITPRGTRRQMHGSIRMLDAIGSHRVSVVLNANQVAGLEENARRVADRYWATKGKRTAKSIQNQLDRPRWHYVSQAPYALAVLSEIERDSGMKMAFHP